MGVFRKPGGQRFLRLPLLPDGNELRRDQQWAGWGSVEDGRSEENTGLHHTRCQRMGGGVRQGHTLQLVVTIGAVLALVSRSTIGKVVAMWLPIMTFFAQGFEHSIVNMFVVPAGMMFGAPVSMGQWLLWNQVPVTIGNIVSGAFFTGLALYATYRVKPNLSSTREMAAHGQTEGDVVFAQATGATQ